MTTRKRVEIQVPNATTGVLEWEDITSYVQFRGGQKLTITRGQANEQSSFSPSTCSFYLNNRDGRFSDRNPTSPYYGRIGRNTKMRVLTNWDDDTFTRGDNAALGSTETLSSLWTESTVANWTLASNAAVAAPSTGNSSLAYTADTYNDVNVLARMRCTSVGAGVTFGVLLGLGQPGVSNQQHCYILISSVSDRMSFDRGDTNPSYSAQTIHPNEIAFPDDPEGAITNNTWYWIRASVSNGQVLGKFWGDGESEPADWMGSIAYTNAGDGSIGGVTKDALDYNPGRAGMYFQNNSGGASTMECSEWHVEEYAYVGEISSWPQRWDLTGRDVYVPINASGIGRRLSVAPTNLVSSIRAEMTAQYNRDKVAAYWPMEEGPGLTKFTNARTGGGPYIEYTGAVTGTAAGYADIPGSAPIVLCGSGFSARGDVAPQIDTTDELSFAAVMNIPVSHSTNTFFEIEVAGASDSIKYWRINYTNVGGGSLNLVGATAAGVTVVSTGAFDYGVNARRFSIGFELVNDGVDCDWTVTVNQISDDGLSVTTVQGVGTFASTTHGRAVRLTASKNGVLNTSGLGHIAVGTFRMQVLNAPFSDVMRESLIAHNNEPASERIQRLGLEYGIPTRVAQLSDSATSPELDILSTPMGPQTNTGNVLGEMQTCADVDRGFLYEPKDGLELAYISRQMLYNRKILLTVNYSDADFSPPFEPQDDDQGFANVVTVIRDGGGFSTVDIDTGRLSSQAPPNGVGRYELVKTLSLGADADTEWQAGWIAYTSSWDEERYPRISFELARAAHSAASRQLLIRDLDVGKSFHMEDLPEWMPQGLLMQMTLGYTLELTHFTQTYTHNCIPGRIFRVGIWNNTIAAPRKNSEENESRWDSRDSTLDADFDAGTDTTFDINFSSDTRRWITTADEPSEFPLMLIMGGVILNCTGISGSTSPQTATVDAAPLNGITKTVASGEPVRVYKPARWAY